MYRYRDASDLFDACRTGNVRRVGDLLDTRRFDVNAEGNGPPYGVSTPGLENPTRLLTAACGSGHVEVARVLIERGADVNAMDSQGYTALFAACKMSYFDVVELLLTNGANDAVIRERVDTGHAQFQFGYRAYPYCPTALQTLRTVQMNMQQREQKWRFAECVQTIGADTLQLSTDAEKLPLLKRGDKSAPECLLELDRCFMHTTKVRHTRRGLIDLILSCCAVLKKMDSAVPTDSNTKHFAKAQEGLTRFKQLQTQIRDSESCDPDTIRERDRLRPQTIDLISVALLHRTRNPVQDIQRLAVKALDKLRHQPPPRDETTAEDTAAAGSLDGLKQMCAEACRVGVQYTAAIGHESSLAIETDLAVEAMRKRLPAAFLLAFGADNPDKTKVITDIDLCVLTINAEMAEQKSCFGALVDFGRLLSVLTSIESALDSIVEYSQKMSEVDAAYAQLQEEVIVLHAGLAKPDVSVVVDQHTQSERAKVERKKWGARIILAADDTEAHRLQKECEAWEHDTRIREKAADRKLSRWLQKADEHYPELLKLPSVLACFDMGEFEMKCAEQGLLRKNDSLDNYTLVTQLSDRPGRPVSLRTDTDGLHVVIKSYNLTSKTLHTHFLRTCSKLGAMRGIVNVISVLGVFTEGNWGHVIFHYHKNGDLAHWIDQHPKRDPQVCLRMAQQVLCAVEALHERQIVHCDLKPENIFLTPTLKAVLGDFDDVRDANSTMTSSVGLTRKYEAPEIRMGSVQRFDKSADVYSLGLVVQNLFQDLCLDEDSGEISGVAIRALIDRMTDTDPARRPTLSEVVKMAVFEDVQVSRQCAICYEAFIAAESLTCRNGHVVCDECLDSWLKHDMANTSHISRNRGWLPCPMQPQGCEKLWQPKTYASHVTQTTFNDAMCLVNKPRVRQELLQEQLREAAESKEFNYIANEILTMKCPGSGHVLDESFDACFALTCSSCPKGRNEFCAFCWTVVSTDVHAHVRECAQNPNPGELFHSETVFHERRRAENQRKLRDYWATLRMDDAAKSRLEGRVQPLLDQLKPMGSYGSVRKIVAKIA